MVNQYIFNEKTGNCSVLNEGGKIEKLPLIDYCLINDILQ